MRPGVIAASTSMSGWAIVLADPMGALVVDHGGDRPDRAGSEGVGSDDDLALVVQFEPSALSRDATSGGSKGVSWKYAADVAKHDCRLRAIDG